MRPKLSDAEPRPPIDFAPVLATPDPILLVGGQAVNLWALYYAERTADLAPFVSRDADVLGDRETLKALSRAAGAPPQFFPLKPPTNEVGVVVATDAKGTPLLIEVLRHVHGVTNEELRAPVYTVAVGTTRVLLPSPIALLQAKIANVADIPASGRQDDRHVRILARLIPAYLQDLQKVALEGRVAERSLIDLLERLRAVITTPKAKKVLRALNIERTAFFAGMGHDRLTKVRAFLEKRLTRS